MDCQLLRRAIFLLYDGSHMTFAVAEHAAIAERIVQNCREHRGCSAFALANVGQFGNRFCPKQRGVATNDQHIAVSILFESR